MQAVGDSSGTSTGLRYVSVCDGIGAAHVAWQPLGWQCQWTSEIEPFPVAVVEDHYGFRNLGDMTKITEDMIDAPVELLVGGTPCQSFSVAGLRGGLADPRGNLALRFVQLAAVMQPKWIVWENVPGVLSSGKGRDFGTFLGALGELGYGFAYRILDAQWFGVAQRRRRVFVVGYLGDWRRAAAVLFERESVFGNPPTRGAKGQGAAARTTSRTPSGCEQPYFLDRASFNQGQNAQYEAQINDDGLALSLVARGPGAVAFGGQMSTPQIDIELSQTLQRKNPQAVAFSAKDNGRDAAEEVTPTMRSMSHSGSHANGGGQLAVAFTKSKRAQSVTDDESWIPGEVTPTMSCFDQGDTRATTVVAFTQNTRDEVRKINGDGQLAGALSAESGSHQTNYVAFANRTRDGIKVPEVMQGGVVPALTNPGGGGRSDAVNIATPMAVRRLTPRECERLQGFPDDYTLVTYRGKPACDGPRYRALGNSMAVPVMRWIGERISMVEGQ